MSFYTRYFLKDLQLAANKMFTTFPSELGAWKNTFESVLKNFFQIVLLTILVTAADIF